MSTPEEAPSSENVFGLDVDTSDELDVEADIEEIAEEAPAEVEEPEAAQEAPAPEAEETPAEEQATEETEVPEPEAQSPSETPAEETPAAEEARKYAGRYESIEDLEQGYTHIQRLSTKQAQEIREHTQKVAQYEQVLKQLAPHVPKLQQIIAEEQDVYGMDPHEVQQRERARAEQALAAQQQQQQVALETNLTRQFMEQNDIVPGSPVAADIYNIMSEMKVPVTPQNLSVANVLAREPKTHTIFADLALDPQYPENLSIAREAASNPRLHKILKAQPHLVDTDEGLELAREQAGSPAPRPTAATTEAQKRKAYVETPSSGAPISGAPGDTPDDDFWAPIEADQRRQRSNAFGL